MFLQELSLSLYIKYIYIHRPRPARGMVPGKRMRSLLINSNNDHSNDNNDNNQQPAAQKQQKQQKHAKAAQAARQQPAARSTSSASSTSSTSGTSRRSTNLQKHAAPRIDAPSGYGKS